MGHLLYDILMLAIVLIATSVNLRTLIREHAITREYCDRGFNGSGKMLRRSIVRTEDTLIAVQGLFVCMGVVRLLATLGALHQEGGIAYEILGVARVLASFLIALCCWLNYRDRESATHYEQARRASRDE